MFNLLLSNLHNYPQSVFCSKVPSFSLNPKLLGIKIQKWSRHRTCLQKRISRHSVEKWLQMKSRWTLMAANFLPSFLKPLGLFGSRDGSGSGSSSDTRALKKAQLKNTIWNLPGQNWCNMQASSRAKSFTFSKGFRKAIKNVRGSKGSTVNFRYLWTKLRPTA